MQAFEQADASAAITSLYETHFDRIFRYICVRIGNANEAEDLASEVFLRAWRSAGSYRDTGAPMEAWLFRIAHNITVDHLRKGSRRPAPVHLEAVEVVEPCLDANPVARLEHAEEIRQLGQAIRKLTINQQQALALRFGAGMNAEQIGEVMEKRPGAIRELQSAALKKLRAIMMEEVSKPSRGPEAQRLHRRTAQALSA